jgi:hypothetical protein
MKKDEFPISQKMAGILEQLIKEKGLQLPILGCRGGE